MADIHEIARGFFQSTPLMPWVFLMFGFFIIEEYAFPHARSEALATNRLVNFACGLMVCTALFVARPFLDMELSFIARHFGGGFVSLGLFSDNPLLTLVISVAAFLFVQDFFFYLWHRAEHKVRSLWDIHAVHHSEQRLNGTSYMRQNWVDGVLQSLFVNIPVVLLLNVSTEAQYDSYLIAAAWNFFGHADIRLELGILTPILTGPQLHRLHHSVLVRHHDKNFAQFFPVWDRLFGTYVAPEPGEFPPTGLASGEKIESLKLMVSLPFQQWVACFSRRQLRAASRVRAYRL